VTLNLIGVFCVWETSWKKERLEVKKTKANLKWNKVKVDDKV
jgi:hypothetical protein